MQLLVLFCLIAASSAAHLYAAPAIHAPAHYAAPAIINTGASAQFRSQDNHGNYNFGYNEDHSTGGTFRRESGDVYGNKVGSYGLRDADGRVRIVNYVADAAGFRANIQSNEPGVEPKDPAATLINKAPIVHAAPAVHAPVVAHAPAHYAAPAIHHAPAVHHAAPLLAAPAIHAPAHYAAPALHAPAHYAAPVAHYAAPAHYAAAAHYGYGHY